jgi:hypothetical protein
MNWMTSPAATLILLTKLENGENPVRDSSTLFWDFCGPGFNFEEFKDRLIKDRKSHEEEKPKGGGFFDPDLANFIVTGAQDPNRAIQLLATKLESLGKKYSISSKADVANETVRLFVLTNFLGCEE